MAGDVCFNGFVYRFGVGYCAQHRPKYIPTGRLIHYHFLFCFQQHGVWRRVEYLASSDSLYQQLVKPLREPFPSRSKRKKITGGAKTKAICKRKGNVANAHGVLCLLLNSDFVQEHDNNRGLPKMWLYLVIVAEAWKTDENMCEWIANDTWLAQSLEVRQHMSVIMYRKRQRRYYYASTRRQQASTEVVM